MVLVRIVFQTKWGKAQEVVESMKQSVEALSSEFGGSGRILTDISGPFHTVVQEYEVESLAKWERSRAKIFSHPEFLKAQAQTEGLIESGYRELYTVEHKT